MNRVVFTGTGVPVPDPARAGAGAPRSPVSRGAPYRNVPTTRTTIVRPARTASSGQTNRRYLP